MFAKRIVVFFGKNLVLYIKKKKLKENLKFWSSEVFKNCDQVICVPEKTSLNKEIRN